VEAAKSLSIDELKSLTREAINWGTKLAIIDAVAKLHGS
jgi:hypothetical protein